MIGGHLLKFSHFLSDHFGYEAALHFLRDRDKKESDFLLTIDSKPWFACEVKLSETTVHSSVKTLQKTAKIPFVYQVVARPNVDFMSDSVRVISANKFLSALI